MKKMPFILIALVMAAMCAVTIVANAATTNPSPASPGYESMVLPFGLVSSSRTPALKFTAPVGYTVQSVSASARLVAGTNPTLKVRGKNGASLVNYSGSLVASGPTALSIVSGATLSDEVTQQIDLIVGGTSPRFDNLTLILFLKRK
jgi:hypothetical protein